MSELKKNQAPSLYNDNYNAASLKILQRNKNDFIDRKTVWRIAVFSFLLGTLLSCFTFWLISKQAPMSEDFGFKSNDFKNTNFRNSASENSWPENTTVQNNTQSNNSVTNDITNAVSATVPDTSASTSVANNVADTKASANTDVTVKTKTAPKGDVIEEWINANLTADGSLKKPKPVRRKDAIEPSNSKVTASPTAAAMQKSALKPNAPLNQQASSNPFSVLEAEDSVITSSSKVSKTNSNKVALQKTSDTKQKNNAKPAVKPESKVKSNVTTEVSQKQARHQSDKKDK